MDTDTLPPAVVFDCDGTLADTESLSDRAWEDILRRHGYTPTDEDLGAVIGRPWPFVWHYFATRAELGDEQVVRARLSARFQELMDEGLVLYDDALDTLRRLARAGVRIGVASSSRHAHVERVLARGGVTDLVTAVVGQDDVVRHKPDPEPYRQAARLLGVEPERCVAVEDTSVGVTSAVAAGMFTVGILRRSTSPEALAAAHRVVDSITVDALTPARGAAHR